jgi:hypothetical protein
MFLFLFSQVECQVTSMMSVMSMLSEWNYAIHVLPEWGLKLVEHKVPIQTKLKLNI